MPYNWAYALSLRAATRGADRVGGFGGVQHYWMLQLGCCTAMPPVPQRSATSLSGEEFVLLQRILRMVTVRHLTVCAAQKAQVSEEKAVSVTLGVIERS